MKPKIFLSYAMANSNLVDEIDYEFERLGIFLTRDIRDQENSSSISEFMRSIGKHDFVITLISDEYLKSENCLYEGLELLLTNEFKERTLPILHNNVTNIFTPFQKAMYYDYWENKMQKAIEYRNRQMTKDAIDMVRKYTSIYNYLNVFLSNSINIEYFNYAELKQNNYIDLLNIIGFEEVIENEANAIEKMSDSNLRSKAVADFMKKHSKHSSFLFYQARLLETLGEYSKARDFYLQLLVKGSTSKIISQVHKNLAMLFFKRFGDEANSQKHFSEALIQDPYNAQLHLDYGTFLLNILEDLNGAKKHFTKAIQIDPKKILQLTSYLLSIMKS